MSRSSPPPIPWHSHPLSSHPVLKRRLGQTPPPALAGSGAQGSPPPLPPPSLSPHSHSSRPSSATVPEPARTFVNGAYYPNWRIYRQESPATLQLNRISHVFYAFAYVKPDGTLYLSDEWADTQMEVDGHKGCLRSFQALKTGFPHLKVVLSVGGAGKGSEPFAALAGDEQARHRFGDSARDLCVAYSLDGIDIDWEHPSDSRQGRNFVLLLETLRRYLPAPTFLLTAALPAGKWALQHIDLAAAAQHLSFINLMTYDFSGPWVDASGHHAQLYAPRRPHNDAAALSCETAVAYVHKMGVPLRKIVLGIPTYGRSFLGCDDIGQRYVAGAGGDECGPGGSFEYKDLPRPGASEHVDMALGAAYCRGGDGGFVSYDNAQTVHQKAAYVREQGLGGMFFWTATADSSSPSRSLILASHSALHPAVLNPVCTLQRGVWQ